MKYTADQINQVLEYNNIIRIIVVNRGRESVQIGKLVDAGDHYELMSKRLVRFCLQERLPLFEGTSLDDPQKKMVGRVENTRIFNYEDFAKIEFI